MGLFRHYWVVFKLAITLLSTAILLIYMGTFREMAGAATDPVVELGLVRNPSPLVHAILALILLMAATLLAIYTPFGMTPFVERQQLRVLAARAIPSSTADSSAVCDDPFLLFTSAGGDGRPHDAVRAFRHRSVEIRLLIAPHNRQP